MDHLHDIFYIHNAIMAEAAELERVVQTLSQEDAARTEGALEQFVFYRKVLDFHEGDEEEVFFPPLAARVAYGAQAYIFDHEHHRKLYGEIEGSLTGLLKAGNSGDWSGLSAKLYRQAVALHATMENHIDKENELLLPIYYENFSDEELKGLMAKMGEAADKMPQEFMMRILPWMFNANSAEDREGMMRGFKEMVPPEMFTGMTHFLAGQVKQEDWQELLRRMPELGG